MPENRTILYCILDWGLGHASRSIPVIKAIQDLGYTVTIATSESLYQNFLKDELPGVAFYRLPGYKPLYSKSTYQVFKLILQSPKFLRVYMQEHLLVAAFIRNYKPVAVFSDNRFGCWSSKVPSVYMTHQLNILRSDTFEVWKTATLMHHYFMKKYSVCMIPDTRGGLSGKLTERNIDLPSGYQFTGIISRFSKLSGNRDRKYILVILSGPEPQRSCFEKIVADAAYYTTDTIVLIRGTNRQTNLSIPSNVTVYNVVNTPVLHRLLEACSYVVCRSGYSSIMDLVALQLPAILIPTPGQTEQEYLAYRAEENGWFMRRDQNAFSYAAKEVVSGACALPNNDQNKMTSFLSGFLKSQAKLLDEIQ